MSSFVAICVPCNDKPHPEFCKSLAGVTYHMGGDKTPLAIINGSASMGAFAARNQCLRAIETLEAEGNSFEWLLWLDSDMIFPGNTYHRLREHNVSIAGATYLRRTPPYDIHGRGLTGQPFQIDTGLVEMASLPTGILLTHRDVYRKLKRPYFRCVADESRGEFFGEDYVFCKMARDAGFRVWLDVDLSKEIGHMSERALFIEGDAYSGVDQAKMKVIKEEAMANG